jgi:hypothetical protein
MNDEIRCTLSDGVIDIVFMPNVYVPKMKGGRIVPAE